MYFLPFCVDNRITKCYNVGEKGDENGSRSMITAGILDDFALKSGDDIDVGKINKAVSDYCDEKGW